MKKVLLGIVAMAIVLSPLLGANASKYENKMRSEPSAQTAPDKKVDDPAKTCPRMKDGKCPCLKNGKCICKKDGKCPCMKDGKCPCMKDGKCTCTKEKCNCMTDEEKAPKKHKKHHKKEKKAAN